MVHWPVPFPPGRGNFPTDGDGNVEIDPGITLVETWRAMVALPATGKVRAIGVSNFSVDAIRALVAATGVTPAVNQVEAHPLNLQDDLVAFCKEHNIHMTAYSPLGNNCESAVRRPRARGPGSGDLVSQP